MSPFPWGGSEELWAATALEALKIGCEVTVSVFGWPDSPPKLAELQRQAVTLAYYGGYTYREVAGLLGIPAGTLSTRMRDGLIRLRDCLGVGS